MPNFGSFTYIQTSLSLGVEQGPQKPQKFDIYDLWLLFHYNILIPRKCPRKTLFQFTVSPSLLLIISAHGSLAYKSGQPITKIDKLDQKGGKVKNHYIPYARHCNLLLIRNRSWILTIHTARILRKKTLEKMFLDFKKWVKSIQTAGCNGACTVAL